MAYKKQKHAYIFIDNNALVPIENRNDVIFHKPATCCFRYDHQTCNSVKWDMMSIIGQWNFIMWRFYLTFDNGY